ncbi:EpsG family protein [Chryseobacterium scophthalmum]|uniref:EpsG family protein n=1 Tax=Chryseobacterium scophthalmum TaxID=59733 RepID=UPI00398B886A
MFTYWSLFLIVMLIQLFPTKSQKQYAVKLIVSLLPIFLYGAFRVNYGLDYSSYEDFFYGLHNYEIYKDDHMEFGYEFLNKILPSFRAVLIVQSVLFCTAYFYLLKYIPPKLSWLAFLILFIAGNNTIFFMLSGIRNGIAISIFILSTPFIIKRKIIQFVLMIYLAFLFHQSIILYAPLAYLVATNKTITKKEISIWIGVVLFFTVSSFTPLMQFVNIFINTYFDRYSTYVSQADEAEGIGILMKLFVLIIVSVTLMFLKKTKLSPTENSIMRLTLLFLISGVLGALNMRMTQVFIPFLIPGLIIVVNRSKDKWIKNTFVVSVLLYLVYAMWLWLESPYFSYQNYESVLF